MVEEFVEEAPVQHPVNEEGLERSPSVERDIDKEWKSGNTLF